MGPQQLRQSCRLSNAPRCKEKSNILTHPDQAVVIGAFSYNGRYVASRLLAECVKVRTLTRNSGWQDPFAGHVETFPATSPTPDGLRRSMEGAGVFYNTYWTYWGRFGRGRNTFEQAVENSKVLFAAVARAGVGRIVYFSVANASVESGLPYFRGKGQVEELLRLLA